LNIERCDNATRIDVVADVHMEAKCTDETENGLIQKYFFPGFICKILSIKGPKRAKILQNQGYGSKNRSSPVLLKTTKTRKIGRLLIQNSIFEI
jgi:hypothetical protein